VEVCPVSRKHIISESESESSFIWWHKIIYDL